MYMHKKNYIHNENEGMGLVLYIATYKVVAIQHKLHNELACKCKNMYAYRSISQYTDL